MSSSAPRSKGRGMRRFLRRVLGLIVLAVIGWTAWVVHEINGVADHDEAQKADAIAVFGAAEYSGRPSPVLHARLDHAVTLYREGIAPLIVTFGGGSDRDSGNTEGAVGRDYLLANGVPFDKIIAETRSVDTQEQVNELADLAQAHGLHHIVVVSDGTHLFRVKQMCEQAGFQVWTSPRPPLGHIDRYDLFQRYAHEVLSYTLFRLRQA